MRSSEFAELRAFVAVAERNNFARGAAQLGLVPSTISQTIKSLEERLGARLFNRTTRRVTLTDAGEKLLARVRPAIVELAAAVGVTNRDRDMPVGTLRLRVSDAAAQVVLAPAMRTFLAAYHGITLDVTVNDNHGDLIGERFDADIRAEAPVKNNVRMLRVSKASRLITVASPHYLARHPAPTTPKDLQSHACIRLNLNNQILAWKFQKGAKNLEIAVNGPLVVNSIELMVRGALDGVAIGHAMAVYVEDHIAMGRLVPLLKGWSPVQSSYYLRYCVHRTPSEPLKALIAFFKTQVGSPNQ
jgi:DNA-binding transcriptional LysR family regulator